MKTGLRLPAIMTLAVLAAFSGTARADPASDAFVAKVNAVMGKISPGNAGELRSACAALVGSSFDVGAMAPTVSAGTWAKLNAKQRATLRVALERRIAGDCRARGRDIAGKTMEVVGERGGDSGDRLIAVRAADGRGRQLIWRLRAGSGGLRAVDVTVDGKSLAVTVEKDARVLLQKAGGDLQQFVKLMGG